MKIRKSSSTSSSLRCRDEADRLASLETIWKNDLPERLDPMMAKELRQSLRRSSFVYPFLAIQLFAVAAMVTEFRIGSAAESSNYVGMLNAKLLWISGPFWMLVGGICVVIMPLGGLILMGQELEEGNHELLLLTKLDRWRIVIGKFITLWGLCALTFFSLLPYVVVRYMIGGIEWWHEAACAGTVLGVAAMVCAGMIGASAFRRIAARIAVLVLFLGSMLAGSAAPLLMSAGVTRSCGIHYHLTALAAVICYSVMGLALARSRLRLSILAYEMNPSSMMIGLLIFSPFVIGMITAFSIGYGGFIGLLGMAFVTCRLDSTFKAPKWISPPQAKVPPPLPP
ncbi:MAG: hypothetical protein HC845_04225 [Akkermansiaceae bacterium]|nr:hypothetical protein [Akkermansiaceae bacterium]